MLKIDTWVGAAAATTARPAPSPSYYFRHVGESAASLARLVKDHSVEHRCFGHVIAWPHERRGPDGRRSPADGYTVVGWTSAAILRSSLSSRLDALNPVAAMQLLDQPEIAQLERATRDFVLLRRGYGLGNDWPGELAGAISAFDLDLWIGPDAAELDGAVALDFDSFRRQFAGTEIAA
jgi:hypothetical protein